MTSKLAKHIERIDARLRQLHERRHQAIEANDHARQRQLEERIAMLDNARVVLSQQLGEQGSLL
jgi:hypothetical protein